MPLLLRGLPCRGSCGSWCKDVDESFYCAPASEKNKVTGRNSHKNSHLVFFFPISNHIYLVGRNLCFPKPCLKDSSTLMLLAAWRVRFLRPHELASWLSFQFSAQLLHLLFLWVINVGPSALSESSLPNGRHVLWPTVLNG